MNKKEQAISYLKKDMLKNLDLLTFLKIYDESEIDMKYCESDGVCFFLKKSNIYCVSTDSGEVAKKVVSNIDSAENCICKNKWDFEVFNEKFHFKNADECYQYCYERDENFSPNENVFKLTGDDINEVKANFEIKISAEEIEDLMKIFNFYCYKLDGKIVGIIGRHIDGEIGFLEVLEQYRKRGIATALTKTIINEDADIIPYSQVLINNIKSINLQEKLGAKQNPTTVFWCYSENY